jgi:hypothetical protein
MSLTSKEYLARFPKSLRTWLVDHLIDDLAVVQPGANPMVSSPYVVRGEKRFLELLGSDRFDMVCRSHFTGNWVVHYDKALDAIVFQPHVGLSVPARSKYR